MSCKESLEKKIKEISLELRELMGVEAPALFNLRKMAGASYGMRNEESGLQSQSFQVH
jgi:hypothetical protein